MTKMTTTAATAILASMFDHDGETDRDTLILALVQHHSCTLNMATKAYASFAKERGLTATITSHKADAMEWLSTEYDDAETISATTARGIVVDLVDRYSVAESTARDYLAAWFKEQGMEMPVDDPRTLIFQYLKDHQDDFLAHYQDAKDAFIEYACNDLGRSRSNANEYLKGMDLHLFLIR